MVRIKRMLLLAALAFGACLGAQGATAGLRAPHGGQIRALIVGIDNYANVQRLKGAVADAKDLSGALIKRGVSDVKVLIDREAVRPAVLTELERLVEAAQAQDLVIISFAGHGTRRRESVPHSKPDGMDEAYILQRFDPASTAPNPDLIIGPEMKHYLARLEAREIDVLFLADTCYGGGMTRQPDSRSGALSYRTSQIGAAAEALLDVVSDAADATRSGSSFRRVTFLAAVDNFSKAPEVDIPGQPTKRGALSYAVARALEGSAPGAVSRGSLFAYARQVVAQYASQRQTIVTEPAGSAGALDVVVWRDETSANSLQFVDQSKPVRVAIAGDAQALSVIRPGYASFVLVSGGDDADVVWDTRAREVIVSGDVIAREIGPRELPGVLDRVRAIAEIALISERRPQPIELLPSNKLHHNGDVLVFEAHSLQDKYAIIVNLSGTGNIQFLYPDPERHDSERIKTASWRLPVKVGKPFGADTVLAISSDQPLRMLASELRQLGEQPAAPAVVQLLNKYLPQTDATRVGFASIFTAP